MFRSGWDFGATGDDDHENHRARCEEPGRLDHHRPSYEYIVFDNATTTTSTLAYPAATLDKSQATLTVRARLNDPPMTIPATGWEYTSAAGTAIRLLPRRHPVSQSAIYEFTYTAKDPVVAGLGLAATRDFISFLRHAAAARAIRSPATCSTPTLSSRSPRGTLNDFQRSASTRTKAAGASSTAS